LRDYESEANEPESGFCKPQSEQINKSNHALTSA
jgi:hypothetical protein